MSDKAGTRSDVVLYLSRAFAGLKLSTVCRSLYGHNTGVKHIGLVYTFHVGVMFVELSQFFK